MTCGERIRKKKIERVSERRKRDQEKVSLFYLKREIGTYFTYILYYCIVLNQIAKLGICIALIVLVLFEETF